MPAESSGVPRAGSAAGRSRLLLVGAGHAHLHLLRHADRLAAAGYDVVLVAPATFDYSGAASAVAAGGRDPATGRVDVAALARAHGVEHHVGRVVGVDPAARTVSTDTGQLLAHDVVSFNLGSVAGVPPQLVEAARAADTVVAVKPLANLVRLRDLLTRPPRRPRGHRVTVVGAGASGLELAGQLSARADVDRVVLLEAADEIGGAGLPPRAVGRVRRLLERRGVVVRTGVDLREVGPDQTVLADGSSIDHDVVVVATGLAPPPLATSPPLGGPDGIPVRATLAHRDHAHVYAAGDCADFLPGRLPRIGVHGVRQGPVLLAALEARTSGTPAPRYHPQRRALAVLDLGGTALAVRGRRWWLGRASLVLKRRIDERWLAGYRS